MRGYSGISQKIRQWSLSALKTSCFFLKEPTCLPLSEILCWWSLLPSWLVTSYALSPVSIGLCFSYFEFKCYFFLNLLLNLSKTFITWPQLVILPPEWVSLSHTVLICSTLECHLDNMIGFYCISNLILTRSIFQVNLNISLTCRNKISVLLM